MALKFYSPSSTIQVLGLQACTIESGLCGPRIISRALCVPCKYPTNWESVQAQQLDLKGFNWGYRDGPTIKRTGYFFKQLRFNSPHPQPSVTLVLVVLYPLLAPVGTRHACGKDRHTEKYSYTWNKDKWIFPFKKNYYNACLIQLNYFMNLISPSYILLKAGAFPCGIGDAISLVWVFILSSVTGVYLLRSVSRESIDNWRVPSLCLTSLLADF